MCLSGCAPIGTNAWNIKTDPELLLYAQLWEIATKRKQQTPMVFGKLKDDELGVCRIDENKLIVIDRESFNYLSET